MKNKKIMTVILSILLVTVITTGIVIASLGGVTQDKKNIFTPGNNIHAKLIEPNWNPAEGLKLVPGTVIRKDPMIVNSCKVDEYVALKLTFQYKNGTTMSGADVRKLLDLLVIDWNPNWVIASGNPSASPAVQPLVYYYNGVLGAGQTTPALFSSIRVKDEADGLTELQLRWLQGVKIESGSIVADPTGLGGFEIKIEGAAIQTEGTVNAAAAAPTLIGLFS